MALGNVFIETIDGNIPSNPKTGDEKVTGLLFDVSEYPKLFTEGYGKNNENKLTLGDVIYLTTFKSAVNDCGIIERVDVEDPEDEEMENFLFGLPAYHIKEFFRMQGDIDGSARLYIMFADCSKNWDAIDTMQKVANGSIYQLGIWTTQKLWLSSAENEPYRLNLVKGLNDKAVSLANQNMPLSIVLNASTVISSGTNLNRIPSCICDSSKVSVIIGQARTKLNYDIQTRLKDYKPVGFLGAVMGALARANVSESIAWVKQFNLFSDDFQDIELGFGSVGIQADKEGNRVFVITNYYESLSQSMLDDFDDKGYIFPIKYAGLSNGVYISKDQTCSNGDFRTIARNRTINKSRRLVRNALLPYVNSPLLVNPATGFLAPSKITAFKNIVSEVLKQMQTDQEISGQAVNIPANQNVLVDDTLRISYSIVPIGTSTRIEVQEGLSLTAK